MRATCSAMMVIKAEDMPDIGDESPIEEEVSSGVSVETAAAEMSQQSRTLRNSIIGLAVFFALVAGLLLAVPGLRAAADRRGHAQLGWIAVGIGLEIMSSAGYVVLFGLVFGML